MDGRQALINSAIFAVAAHAIAPAPIGPRLSCGEVNLILRENRLEEVIE